MRWWLFALFVTLVVAAAAVVAWRMYEAPLAMKAARVEVRVAPGASARSIAHQLQRAGVTVNADAFVAAARTSKATQSLRAGRYEFNRGMSIETVLDKLRRGDVLRERITIVEGWNFRDMRAALSAQQDLRADSAKMTDAEILRAIGATETHPEGLFAPDTYVYDPGSSDLEVFHQAYRAQATALQQEWERRDGDVPYDSAYEALIMASIVEKETGQHGERRRIAGVFANRLKRRMLLQTDPSVIYGIGEKFDGNLRKRDLETDSPYNTYTRAGLPPTPIALPGRAAIAAALNPEPTRALFFVARGDGTSYFSETLAEHNRAVNKYQLGGRQ